MDRRTTESLSAAMSSGAGGSVIDDETGGEAWLCRSTVCMSEGEEDDDSGTEACSWSQLNTPVPFGGGLDAKTNGESRGDCMETVAGRDAAEMSSSSPTRQKKRILPRIPGFSNSEALRPQLPRAVTKNSHMRLIHGVAKAEGQCKTPLATNMIDKFSPSKDEVEANRRKWDLERKLQDADHMWGSVGVVNDVHENDGDRKPLHVAAFQLSPVVSSISLVLGLVCAGVAHGSVCPNTIALRVEAQFYKPESILSPMSPEDEEESNSEDESGAETAVPATPILKKTHRTPLFRRVLPCMASCPPVARMCFAMLLYLVSAFLSSVVELYRRKASVSPSALPRSCGNVHSDFAFLWTLPYVVLLGASDALFRVSLQEQCHELARDSFPSAPSATKPPRHWTGAVQGAISLAEALGYTAALALVAVLSRWLFRPELTDMALLFLLLTTVVALTHALLNRIAARAQAYQRTYSSALHNK
ncbi:hypothetical protein PF005_g1397 [Phytophthora fragariae]|uniref:Transmembrane protein n=1 Tax=Phytophthora fragariae TaxID=53985 RepID=A0A6A3ZII1_9STRA|nr:hypothetical protein PF005_g1397 [Phytophthora fragariae]